MAGRIKALTKAGKRGFGIHAIAATAEKVAQLFAQYRLVFEKDQIKHGSRVRRWASRNLSNSEHRPVLSAMQQLA